MPIVLFLIMSKISPLFKSRCMIPTFFKGLIINIISCFSPYNKFELRREVVG
jgi:hypothetical protein